MDTHKEGSYQFHIKYRNVCHNYMYIVIKEQHNFFLTRDVGVSDNSDHFSRAGYDPLQVTLREAAVTIQILVGPIIPVHIGYPLIGQSSES